MGDKYIQNVHTNSIKASYADKTVVAFRPQSIDHFSGRQTHTGYTRLTADEYDRLLKESPLFNHFIKLKKLVVHDELPPDAQTPHEALVSARKDVGRLNTALKEAEAEKAALQEKIAELDTRYNELLAASGGDKLSTAEAALKEAQEKIRSLTESNEAVKKEFDALKREYGKLLKKEK